PVLQVGLVGGAAPELRDRRTGLLERVLQGADSSIEHLGAAGGLHHLLLAVVELDDRLGTDPRHWASPSVRGWSVCNGSECRSPACGGSGPKPPPRTAAYRPPPSPTWW